MKVRQTLSGERASKFDSLAQPGYSKKMKKKQRENRNLLLFDAHVSSSSATDMRATLSRDLSHHPASARALIQASGPEVLTCDRDSGP